LKKWHYTELPVYRNVEELMSIRGVKVDHAAIQRCVFNTPLI